MQIDQLVQKQRDFFLSGATLPLEFRKEQLRKLREAIVKNADRFVDAIYSDLRRTGTREVDKPRDEIDHFLANLDEWAKPEKVYKQPLGVVLVIGPFNYPILLVLRPAIAALAAGNTVIIKPSEISAASSRALSDALSSVFDEKILAVVEGDATVAKTLLDQRFDHIFYTGNPQIGRVVMEAASRHLTPVTLELGGKCPAVVLDDVDVEKVAQSIGEAKCSNAGQVCMSCDYILTTPTIKPKLVEALKSYFGTTFNNKPRDSPDYSRLVNQRHFDRVMKLIKSTKGTLLYKPDDEPDRDDCYIGPHIFEVDASDPLMQEEVFGPVASLLTVDGIDEAIKFINERERPLLTYVYTNDESAVERFTNETFSGMGASNGAMMYMSSGELPFGGVGNSGFGRYGGRYGFTNLSHEKAVVKATRSANVVDNMS